MKTLFIALLISTSLFAFNREEVLGLSSEQRVELLNRLPAHKRPELADSLVIWGAQEATRNAYEMAKRFKPEMEAIRASMEQANALVEALAAKNGLCTILFLLLAVGGATLFSLAWFRKSRRFFVATGVYTTIITGTFLYVLVGVS